ncbi:MAG: NAD-glutamate dehydrogenase [Rhizobiaceae bacterium]|nr:NAD-glutamate dehydrogenase [Rhizobiaceae bacterium]
MKAGTKASGITRKSGNGAGGGRSGKDGAGEAKLLELMRARAAEEDIAAYDPAVTALSARLAFAALKQHRRGDSVIAIDDDPALVLGGTALTAVTVVNDNMPFLFDSISAEVNETGGEATLVLHPVIAVHHDRSGVASIAADAGAKNEPDADRVSLIHIHVPRLSAAEKEALRGRLQFILGQVKLAVADWKPMLARLDQAISAFRYGASPLDKADVSEAIAFLEWLRDNNFTFLGMREYDYRGGEKDGTLERSGAEGLGILADPDVRVLRRGSEPVTTTPEIRAFLHGPEPLIVTKANAKSVVHRRIYLDYIGVKTFDAKGRLSGELRIVGLFTSTAYTRSVMSIPYLRSKAHAVIARSGFDASDHSGKALINVLEAYPRDELFQISAPILRKHAMAILALGERPRVRVLYRVDPFDRFVSIIVFVPRDRYDSRVRVEIGDHLKKVFEGRLSAYYPAFPEGTLARVHFIIGRSGGKTPKPEPERLEGDIRAIVRTWDDGLREAAREAGASAATTQAALRCPESYRSSFGPQIALRDAAMLAGVDAQNPIAIAFLREEGQKPAETSLRIAHHGAPVALSRRVPLLENMGFRVVSERTFEIDGDADGAAPVFLHDMELESADGRDIDLSDGGDLFASVFLSVWRGEADNDGYNALGRMARLAPRQIRVLRAYGRYLQQAGIPQSPEFVAGVLNRYPEVAKLLSHLFTLRHDREQAGVEGTETQARIATALEAVPSLDDDTIIRRFLNLVLSTVRTNHFAPRQPGVSLAFKFDAKAVAGLPEPRPWREIFVYGPEVEGVHLRFGPVARGGLRWSDRAQDYRTEVLGLVKAQQVKNAVIVPVGAKGGFFPKQLPAGGSRDAVFAAGTAAYVNFVSSLLSVTDNIVDDHVVHPKGVQCRDGDDPYFVVAADKGTATFSDTANAISQSRDFWLDDAFASGGSAGYDHKKMGITARGAWEAVKRHFREMDRNIQKEPFTVAGVGDMSGDVFGNGMLLSPEIRLVAAFDHRDIFIDPTPDPVASMAERQRLFAMPRSSWQDYDRAKLSKGGMIIPRTLKSVELTAEAAAAIGLPKGPASPAEIMSAVLKCPVDLLWFGGIGTYVRGSGETNAEVGDKANDAIRVTGAEVGAKVIGEGANLGMTQRGRIEFGLRGGRCNSDAIDNSGGVNSSDVEVNIKIAFSGAMRSGRLKREARNKLLAEMTDEVASLVLANNYQQTLAISLAERRGLADLPHQARMMASLEARGLLNRAVEYLPSPAALTERQARRQPLTRAELGVLLAYAKLTLFDDVIASAVPDDAHLQADLVGYFPAKMQKKFGDDIRGHRLRREIVATELGNDAVNRGGPSFVSRMVDMTGASAGDVVAAYAVARDGFVLAPLYRDIDALDNKVGGVAQLGFYGQVGRLVHAATAWLLKNGGTGSIGERAAVLSAATRELEPVLPKLLPDFLRLRLEERRALFAAEGAPAVLAARLAFAGIGEMVPDIALVARAANAALADAATAYCAVTEAFRIGPVEDAARAIQTGDYYEELALNRALDTIGAARRGIAMAALKGAKKGKGGDAVASWLAAGGERIARTRERLQALTEGGDISVSRLSVAAGLMADLAA